MGKNISEHITEAEAFKSQSATRYGIDNIATDLIILLNMATLATQVFEPLRSFFNKPIAIPSFYRSAALNKRIGGAKNSQHVKGQAMDIDGDIFGGVTNKEIFDYIRDHLSFDQLILEGVSEDGTGGWVHVSYVSRLVNRKQVLKATFKKGKAIYEKL